MIDYSLYPICDADIWVNLCLGNLEEELFKKYKKIIFVDVVRDEILRWKYGKYGFISRKFLEKVEQGSIILIEVEKLDSEDQLIIERQLIEDAGYSLGFKTPKTERKNMGEYVSAIVADYFGILFMKSDDHLFKDGGRGKVLYPELEVRGWNSTIIDLVPEVRKRSSILEKVKRENLKMNKEKDNYNNGEANLEDILKLKEYFASKF